MMAQSAMSQTRLYDRDLALWYAETLNKLKAGELNALDIEHLIEEIAGLAGRDRRELKNRLKVLLTHLLKRLYVDSPDDSRGWENTIDEQREQLQDILDQSPSLQNYLNEVFDDAWQSALKRVRKEYPQVQFPDTWQLSREIEVILTEEVWSK